MTLALREEQEGEEQEEKVEEEEDQKFMVIQCQIVSLRLALAT